MTAESAVSVLAKSPALPIDPGLLRTLYEGMLRIRVLDERMMTLQRQGRIGFYGACPGQEAACIGSAAALEPHDWVFPALREGGAMLLRGFPLVPYIAQLFGNRLDLLKGRQMPSHAAARSVNQVSWGSCIGTQLPHAVGAAHAARIAGKPDVMLAYMGDGATSTSDFHSSLTFAGVWKAPVVFLCQNNHWSISIPTNRQTAARTLADKARGYGIPGVRVDGNDVIAVYLATAAAVARARRGEGPTFIEAETYRMGAHSSSDDPSRYRDEREVEVWRRRDPIERARRWMDASAGWDDRQDAALRESLLAAVNAALKTAEEASDPDPASLFEDVFAETTWNLQEERTEMLAGLEEQRAIEGHV
jgi:pyruvate dehydrogenase E1 component alpha subunit/2-oxoisovalerate dehydrogenase E1 component alpha subunit